MVVTVDQRKIKVCVVAPSLEILGGQAVQAMRLIKRLRDEPSLSVEFVPINPRLPPPLDGVQKIKYLRTIINSIVYVITLLRTLPHCDVVHIFSASYFSYLLAPLPALIVAKLFRKPTILNYRSGEAEDHLLRWRLTAVPTMRRLADVIAVPSGYLVKVFAGHGLQAISINNFIELDEIPYRRRLSVRPIFLVNRNFEPLYNVLCVVEAFALIKEEIPEARLLLAGDGSDRGALERRVNELRLHDVEFLGRVAPAAMCKLYNTADIYLNSPNVDNMPGSIIEAYAAGLPVVTTGVGGIPYILQHEVTGLIVPRGDCVALADQAVRLIRDDGLALRLADAARSQCLTQYAWENARSRWMDTYARLAA